MFRVSKEDLVVPLVIEVNVSTVGEPVAQRDSSAFLGGSVRAYQTVCHGAEAAVADLKGHIRLHGSRGIVQHLQTAEGFLLQSEDPGQVNDLGGLERGSEVVLQLFYLLKSVQSHSGDCSVPLLHDKQGVRQTSRWIVYETQPPCDRPTEFVLARP